MKRNLGMTLPFLSQKVKKRKKKVTLSHSSEPQNLQGRYKSHANPPIPLQIQGNYEKQTATTQ